MMKTAMTTLPVPPKSFDHSKTEDAVMICRMRVNHLPATTWDNDLDPSTLPLSYEQQKACPLPDNLHDDDNNKALLWKRLTSNSITLTMGM